MNIGEESRKRANENEQDIKNALAKRGFHDIKGISGNAGMAQLFFKNEEARRPIADMLLLIQSAESQDDLWNQLRKLKAVLPQTKR